MAEAEGRGWVATVSFSRSREVTRSSRSNVGSLGSSGSFETALYSSPPSPSPAPPSSLPSTSMTVTPKSDGPTKPGLVMLICSNPARLAMLC